MFNFLFTPIIGSAVCTLQANELGTSVGVVNGCMCRRNETPLIPNLKGRNRQRCAVALTLAEAINRHKTQGARRTLVSRTQRHMHTSMLAPACNKSHFRWLDDKGRCHASAFAFNEYRPVQPPAAEAGTAVETN